MAKWWDMSIDELAEEAETGLRTPDIRPEVSRRVIELLHAKVSIASAREQRVLASRLVVATWVLAGATIAVVIATVGLIVATLGD